MSRFIGIDFSGGARPWRPLVKNPTVWLALVENNGDGLRLDDLRPVQLLAGDKTPFDRLVKLLAAGDFEVAAVDAPFSLPFAHMPRGGHTELLQLVRTLPNGVDRPFPLGASIVALGEGVAPKVSDKPLRQTEAYWAAKGVNTRSTMWNGPRGGAPFAAACLRLLERSERPCWPWTTLQRGVLCEAFPAAQLRHWRLPHQGYSEPAATNVREVILAGLRKRMRMNSTHADAIAKCADALDAVIAVFAAIAVADQAIVGSNISYADGNISVAE
jgi:hypothetical protein